MEAEEKKLRVLKAEIEASKHSDAAGSSDKVHTHTIHTHGRLFDILYSIFHRLKNWRLKKTIICEFCPQSETTTTTTTTHILHCTTCMHACRRIKIQHQRLSQEMQEIAVAGLIQRKPKMKASRSLPAIIMKQPPRARVGG